MIETEFSTKIFLKRWNVVRHAPKIQRVSYKISEHFSTFQRNILGGFLCTDSLKINRISAQFLYNFRKFFDIGMVCK